MSSIFKKPKAPPAAPPPKAMPVPDDAANRRTKLKGIASSRKRGGRASTILSDKESLG